MNMKVHVGYQIAYLILILRPNVVFISGWWNVFVLIVALISDYALCKCSQYLSETAAIIMADYLEMKTIRDFFKHYTRFNVLDFNVDIELTDWLRVERDSSKRH